MTKQVAIFARPEGEKTRRQVRKVFENMQRTSLSRAGDSDEITKAKSKETQAWGFIFGTKPAIDRTCKEEGFLELLGGTRTFRKGGDAMGKEPFGGLLIHKTGEDISECRTYSPVRHRQSGRDPTGEGFGERGGGR